MSAAIKKVPCHITVAGRLDDYRFHICKDIASALADRFSQVTFNVEGMTEVDWTEYIEAKKKEFRRGGEDHKTSPIVFYNSINYVGNEDQFRTWCFRAYGHKPSKSNNVIYRGLAKMEYSSWLTDNKNSFCYFDLQQGDRKLGRVVFELYRTVCPRTCQNFMDLCTGAKGSNEDVAYSYKGTIFHRAIPNVFVQGGDILGGSGDKGEAAGGGLLADENFAIRHDRPGILAMANDGSAHTNGSQFYVTLRAMSWLDTQRVAFGRVISGMRAVKLASRVPTLNQRPLDDVRIADCGEYLGPGAKADGPVIEAIGDATQIAQLKEVFTLASSGSKRLRPEELMIALKAPSGPLITKFARLASAITQAIETYVVKTRTTSVTLEEFVAKAVVIITNAPELPIMNAPTPGIGKLSSNDMSSIAEVFAGLLPDANGMVDIVKLEEIAATQNPPLMPNVHFGAQSQCNVNEMQEYFNALLGRDANSFNTTLQAFRKQVGLQ